MDANMFPDKKDWGGDKAYEKFMLMAKELGMTIVDTSPGNTNSAVGVAGGHFPKEIDMDASARILSRLRIAEAMEGFALNQIGFNQYRLGAQSNSAAVGTVEQGQARSFAQTESLFTNFSNYVSRCHKMDLDMAQFVQSQEKDITIMYVKSDLSRGFVKMAGTELLLSDMHVYIENSQEQVRQLEMLKQLALSNNTTNATVVDLAEIITSNSPAQIKVKLQKSYDEQQAKIQQQFQLEEQKITQAKELEMLKLQQKDKEATEGNETRKEVAYIQTFGRQMDNLKDTDTSGEPDVLEYEKLGIKQAEADEKANANRQKQQLDREKAIAEQEYRLKKLDLDKQKIDANLKIQEKEIEYAKIMKGKELEVKKKAANKKPK